MSSYSRLREYEDNLQTAQALISDLEMRLEDSKAPPEKPTETEGAGLEQRELLDAHTAVLTSLVGMMIFHRRMAAERRLSAISSAY